MLSRITNKIISSDINYTIENVTISLPLKEELIHLSELNGEIASNILYNNSEISKQKDLYGLIERLSEKNQVNTYTVNTLTQLVDTMRYFCEINNSNYIICNKFLSERLESHRSFLSLNSPFRDNGYIYVNGTLGNYYLITNPYLLRSDNTILFGPSREILYIENFNKTITLDNYHNFKLTENYNFVNSIDSYLKFKKIIINGEIC